jgi:dihydrodipicolinate synthase/N-acetylneuraminate lyase
MLNIILKMKLKQGAYVVLPTPFCLNGKVDYISLNNLIQKLINSTISGIVILGTTSESPTL